MGRPVPVLPLVVTDSHNHANWLGRDAAGLISDMDERGIGRAWLLTWEIRPDEYRAGGVPSEGITLRDTLEARDRYPDRLVAGFAPHPLAGDAVRRFADAVRTRGVRVCGEWKCRMPMDDPRCLELFRKAGELDCPVVFHLEPPELPGPGGTRIPQRYWSGGTIPNVERVLGECPGTAFVGHAQGFWREISGDADTAEGAYPTGPVVPGGRLYGLFDRFPNLHADLSAGSGFNALARDPGHAKAFLIRYARRLLFGRDDYSGRLFEFLTGLGLPQDDLAAILGGNAERLLGAS